MENMDGILYQSTLQRHCILNVKEKFRLQQQVFPIFSMITISQRKNILMVDTLELREINKALKATHMHYGLPSCALTID